MYNVEIGEKVLGRVKLLNIRKKIKCSPKYLGLDIHINLTFLGSKTPALLAVPFDPL